jgi:hypothetical protein
MSCVLWLALLAVEPEPEPPSPITRADVAACTVMVWDDQAYRCHFDRATNYLWFHDGKDTHCVGCWLLEPDSSFQIAYTANPRWEAGVGFVPADFRRLTTYRGELRRDCGALVGRLGAWDVRLVVRSP